MSDTITVHHLIEMTGPYDCYVYDRYVPDISAEEEIERAVDVHVRAYMGDDAVKMLIGGDWSLLADHGRAMIRAALSEGIVYAVKHGNDIVAFGLWFEPGKAVFSSAAQRALGFDDFFEKLNPEVQFWYQNEYPQSVGAQRALLYREEETYWWCSSLATDPDHQNKGYGKAIVNTAFEKAKKVGHFISFAAGSELN
ncbi:hypothetical protein V5O48_019275, partial [Marasmius crinis-equi]